MRPNLSSLLIQKFLYLQLTALRLLQSNSSFHYFLIDVRIEAEVMAPVILVCYLDVVVEVADNGGENFLKLDLV